MLPHEDLQQLKWEIFERFWMDTGWLLDMGCKMGFSQLEQQRQMRI
jgi:hypothetical protein